MQAEANETLREANEAKETEGSVSRKLQALMTARHEKQELLQTLAAQLEQLQAPHHAVLVSTYLQT